MKVLPSFIGSWVFFPTWLSIVEACSFLKQKLRGCKSGMRKLGRSGRSGGEEHYGQNVLNKRRICSLLKIRKSVARTAKIEFNL